MGESYHGTIFPVQKQCAEEFNYLSSPFQFLLKPQNELKCPAASTMVPLNCDPVWRGLRMLHMLFMQSSTNKHVIVKLLPLQIVHRMAMGAKSYFEFAPHPSFASAFAFFFFKQTMTIHALSNKRTHTHSLNAAFSTTCDIYMLL